MRIRILSQSNLKLSIVICLLVCGCWFNKESEKGDLDKSPKEKSAEVKTPTKPKIPAPSNSKPLPSKVANGEEPAKVTGAAGCFDLEKKVKELRNLPEGRNFVVTQFSKRCTTEEGTTGYEKDSDWIAMGFPCSYGGGKLKVTGNVYSPTILSYVLTTDCPMNAEYHSLEELGRKHLGLSSKAKLLAINPFAVQYYEVKQVDDSGLGFVVELRSVQAKQRLWRDFYNNGKPIGVLLYGRQNAWVLGNEIYRLSAQLVKEPNSRFRLQVEDIQVLSEDEIKDAHKRCTRYNSDKECSNVFHD